jgi:hypothetical protein
LAPANPPSTRSSITWCRCRPAYCDPPRTTATHPWITDGTLIPVHDQSITARRKSIGASSPGLKDWQILRQCRRRADAIDHSLQIIAGLWNLKTRTQLRVKS